VADEAPLRLLALDDVEDETPRDLDHLVAAAEAVPVVEGFEIIQIGIGKGKGLAAYETILDLPVDGDVAGKPRQGIDLTTARTADRENTVR
jgi:hypothetical protein